MITLPVTCNQLLLLLWILSGIVTLVIYLFYYSPIAFGLSAGILMVGTLMGGLLGLIFYFEEHEFPFRCKCGKE